MMQHHVGGEVLLEPVLEMLNCRTHRRLGWRGRAISRRFRRAALREMFGHELFRRAHGEIVPNDFLGEQRLFIARFQREQDLGVTHGNAILCKPALDLLMKIEQAHAIGNGGAALAHLLGDVFLAQAKFPGQAREGVCFFDRVEVLALEVFDEGQLEDILVGSFADDDGRFRQAARQRRSPAINSNLSPRSRAMSG